MTPLISLCMIVKDEESVLERCLKSVQGYVDEIIIVDTGSTDATRDIASRFTDRIYTFEWVNDFSAARNEALKYARGKWILVLDADEYFEESEIRKLRELLGSMDPEPHLIYNLTIISLLGEKHNFSTNESKVGRVFGNHLDIRYVRPIHEQPISARPGVRMHSASLPVRLFHSGYVEETIRAKNKHQRNLELFKKLEATTGLSAYDHLQLGNQYSMMREYDKALEHLNKALQNAKDLGAAYQQVLFTTIQVLINKGDLAKAYHFFEQHLESYEFNPDICTVKGIILYNLGFHDKAKQTFHMAVEEAERRAARNEPIAITSPDTALRLPLYQLAMIYEKEKNFAQTVYYLTKIIVTNPKEVSAVSKLVELMSLQEKTESIIHLLDQLLNPDALLTAMLGKISIKLGITPLATHYAGHASVRKLLKPDERIRYAIMTNDPAAVRNEWEGASPAERQAVSTVKHYIIGAFVWNRPEWLEDVQLPDDHVYMPLLAWIKSWFAGIADRSLPHGYAAEMLQELYTMGKLEAFDRLMEAVDDLPVVNQLANFFYGRHQIDLALQYYHHLLTHDGMDANSYANLADWCTLQRDVHSAQQYWEQAIKLEPNRKLWYIKHLLISPDPAARNAMKQKLFELDPGYKNLSLLHEL
ncbi:Glycosyl transferase family 2 [Thermobacillus xylanilyticus]|uniref:Glycosyl transferase family 2 n=1 Tax=Thermobacillus xylanilyticus TaxID=76633 RepID=A0ABN7S216_THEXY|nr:TPR domain-containing glycosyltransferase [Thermobacillus xylanilyticus]CAG5088542.1 Glycosyl transferase family 2 [Thermobacillus xylanilyticus]